MRKIIFIILFIAGSIFSQNNSNSDYRMGLSIGNPTGFQVSLANIRQNFSFRLNAGSMLLTNSYGAEGSVYYKVYGKNSFQQHLGFHAGYSYRNKIYNDNFFGFYWGLSPSDREKTSSVYFGPVYQINWSHFFIQASAAFGTGNFKNPRLMTQFGYYFDL